MNNETELHKPNHRTSLCVGLIPLFETVAPEDMQGGTDRSGKILRHTVLQSDKPKRIILSCVCI